MEEKIVEYLKEILEVSKKHGMWIDVHGDFVGYIRDISNKPIAILNCDLDNLDCWEDYPRR